MGKIQTDFRRLAQIGILAVFIRETFAGILFRHGEFEASIWKPSDRQAIPNLRLYDAADLIFLGIIFALAYGFLLPVPCPHKEQNVALKFSDAAVLLVFVIEKQAPLHFLHPENFPI